MILECSRGHRLDTEYIINRRIRPGSRCPMLMSYDRIDGRIYCGRILKKAINKVKKENDK